MATAYTWRLGFDPTQTVHYEVGNYATGVDINDARQFAVLECWFDQATAARRAIGYNTGLTPPTAWTPFNGQGSKPKAK